MTRRGFKQPLHAVGAVKNIDPPRARYCSPRQRSHYVAPTGSSGIFFADYKLREELSIHRLEVAAVSTEVADGGNPTCHGIGRVGDDRVFDMNIDV